MVVGIKELWHRYCYDIKIYHKVIILFVITAFIPIVLVSFIYYYKSEQVINNEVSTSYKQLLCQYVDGVNYKLNLYDTLFNNIVYNSLIQEVFCSLKSKYLNYSEKMDVLNNISDEIDYMVFNKYQNETYNLKVYPFDESTLYYQAHIGNLNTIKDADWYEDIVSGKVLNHVEINTIPNLNINTMTFVRSIPSFKYGNYRRIGIIKLDIILDKLFEVEPGMMDKKKQQIFILDDVDNVIYTTDGHKRFGLNFSKKIMAEDTPQIQYTDILGKKGILVCKAINHYDWKALMFFDNSEIKRKLMDTGFYILLTDVILFSVLIIIITVFSEVFSGRVDMLIGKMKCVMKGDLDVKCELEGKDEVAVLDRAFNHMVRRLKELIDENYVQKLEKTEAQINALQAQINPHFLYNTLECINSMASIKGCFEICNISQKLGEIFRYNSNYDKREFVTIREEVHYLKDYEYIQKVRFGDKFKILFNIPDELYGYKIPKFILQPIVENSIYHGFIDKDKIGQIEISVVLDGDNLIIKVLDNGIGMPAEREKALNDSLDKPYKRYGKKNKGIGISNVNSRIKLCYGDAYGLSVKSVEHKGTEVMIVMPAECF